MNAPRHDVTTLVISASGGDPDALSELMPLVYEELRRLAAAYLARQRTAQAPGATSLVHEAYMRLVDQSQVDWQGRAHFSAVAATVMRRILIDEARKRATAKHGGKTPRVPLDVALNLAPEPDERILVLDEALRRLEGFDKRKARVVELRFYGGLSMDEAAVVLGISPRTAAREWRFAKAWLHDEISDEPSE